MKPIALMSLLVLAACNKESGLNDTQRMEVINIARAESADGQGPREVKDRLDHVEARLDAADVPSD